MADQRLIDLAHAHGVATSYDSWKGRATAISAESIRHVLAALGVAADTDAQVGQSLAAVADAPWRRALPPVVVCREGDGPWVPVHLPHGTSLHVWAELEDGASRDVPAVEHLVEPRHLDGVLVGEAMVEVPADLPLGWHTLHAELGDGTTATTTLVVTPRRLPLHPALDDRRAWGLMSQVYAARSATSWGLGDLGDLAETAARGADLGADFLLVNPLHAAEPIAPMEPSPYLPTTRRFANPLYLAVEEIAELARLTPTERSRVERIAAGLRVLNAADTLDRNAVWAGKDEALRLIHAAGRSARRQRAFDRFVAREGRGLRDHATWCALAVTHGLPWQRWPEELHDPHGPAVSAARTELAEEVDYHLWCQWQVAEQLAAAQREAVEAGMRIGVVHDLAVGVSPEGADSWMLADALAGGVSVGAPPDQFNQRGQYWGQPPWHPQRLAELGYAPYRDMLRSVLRDAGGIRIDHILGLFRLWWVPQGHDAVDGTYVHYDGHALLGILALEAQRAEALVIGEDLGVVASELREAMRERRILGTSILWFEWAGHEPLPPEGYRELCMASVTTHDLPPTAGYLRCAHVDTRDELGLLTRPYAEERADEAATIDRVREALVARGLLDPDGSADDMVVALHAWLAASPARLVGVALPDLAGDRRSINQPGTDEEYPNWRVPVADAEGAPMALADILTSPLATRIAAVLSR